MLKKSISFALLVVAASAHAVTLYNDTTTSDVFYTGAYNRSADDFQFGSKTSTYNPAVFVTEFELGYQTTATAPTSFDMVVNFYQDMDITSTSGTTSILKNLAKSYTFSFNNITKGTNSTGLITLSDFGGGFTLPAINDFSKDGHGVEVLFYNKGTTTINNTVRVLFEGDPDPAVGYSYDTYGRDVDGNGLITGGERHTFNNANTTNTNANFYMRIEGQPVPEPASFAALGLGAAAMLRRRKRA